MVRVREIEEEAKGCPSAISLSADGDIIGVAYFDRSTPNEFTICVYKTDSGQRLYAHSLDKWFIGIWTHDQSFRFAAVESWTMTVWEVDHTFNSCFKYVGAFDLPSDFSPLGSFSFFPALYRLAYVAEGAVLIWDARSDKFIRKAKDENFRGSTISFSSDGHFLACGTTGRNIYLWDESPTGYALNQKFTSSALSPIPLFSPDGTSILTWDSSTIKLWPPGGPPTLASHGSLHTTSHSEHFILAFSLADGVAAFARGKNNMVTVLDLERGTQRLAIDAHMGVQGLRVVEGTIVVEGLNKVITWTLPAGDSVPGVVMKVEDSVTTTEFEVPQLGRPQSVSILPDGLHIAVRGTGDGPAYPAPLSIYDMSRSLLARTFAAGDTLWFSRSGSQVWCDGEVGKEQGWRVVKDNGPTRVSLDPLPIGNPPEGYPWRSSRGFTVTDDWWILSPEGKRLMWMPHRWRSYERKARVWSGPFLALLHDTLPEPVILKLEP